MKRALLCVGILLGISIAVFLFLPKNPNEKFKSIFGFTFIENAELLDATEGFLGDPRFVGTVTDGQFEELSHRAMMAGYSPWRSMADEEDFGHGDFYIKSLGLNPVVESQKDGVGGTIYYLFFRKSTGEFYAVSFYN